MYALALAQSVYRMNMRPIRNARMCVAFSANRTRFW